MYPLLQRALERPRIVIAAVILATLALAVPAVTMAPTESASTEPGGDVFTARDRVDDLFVSSVHPTFLIAVADNGDLLTPENLGSLLAAEEVLRTDPVLGETLFGYYDTTFETDVDGVATIATLIDAELDGALAAGTASATEVDSAADRVIERIGIDSQRLGLSVESEQVDGRWVVPATTIQVLHDNDALGFGNVSVTLGGGTEIEEFDRDVQAVLRSAEGLTINGVAIDVNLTSQEQGAVAGPFIGFTVLAVLIVVGLVFRSYWSLAVVGSLLFALLVWLKGITNLIGLKDDLVLSLIVPIAMISFGVDFAFHAIGRYREERAEGRIARPALATGLTAVSGALLLALASDSVAFLSNLVAGIESITQFGLGAAVALVSAYLLLGLVAPFLLALVEDAVPTPTAGRRSTVLRLAGGLAAGMMVMASVLLLVFIQPAIGVAVGAVTVLGILVVPFLVHRRREGERVGTAPVADAADQIAPVLGGFTAAVAARPWLVLPATIVFTVLAATQAVQVPTEFDVEDFFAADTDFVQGLNAIDTHVGPRGGEPAQLYIEADLTDPAALAAIADTVDSIAASDTTVLSRGADGIFVETGVLGVFDDVFASPVALGQIEQLSGVAITDADTDGIPDTTEQVEAVFAVGSQTGIPLDAERLAMTPDAVRTSAAFTGAGDDGQAGATVIQFQVPDSRSQESVAAAREFLEPYATDLSVALEGSFVQVTGSAFVREASLQATSDALLVSLPIAVVLCLIVGATFLRSLRYGLASVVPILMVVAWLYGFMQIAGYAINLVTATIAAVSIGIGIDFAIHFIARYREELARTGDRLAAARATGEGTGTALVASAISSSLGFGILAFAPMPLFAAYGLLTALMIGMALVATMLVLPALLVLITSDGPAADDGTTIVVPDHPGALDREPILSA